MNSNSDVFSVSTKLLREIKEVVKSSIKYEKSSGKSIVNTGEIGEVLIAEKLGLRLFKSEIKVGYDAIDKDNNRVQIKTRRIKDQNHSHPNIGVFSDHPFDYAIYVQLNEEYIITDAWQVDFSEIDKCITDKKFEYDKKYSNQHNLKQKKLKNQHEQQQKSLPLNQQTDFEPTPYTSKFKRQLTINEFINLNHKKIKLLD